MQRALTALARPIRQPAFLPLTKSTAPYPFSKAAKTYDHTEPLPEPLLRGKALMEHLDKTLPSPAAQALLATHFNPRHAEQLLPGSVLSVTLPTGSFAGVLISVRHKGNDTSFTLRNVVQRTGIEIRFNVGSPMIKELKVISRAGGEGSGKIGRRMRRAKLFYLRDQPAKMTAISTAVKKATA